MEMLSHSWCAVPINEVHLMVTTLMLAIWYLGNYIFYSGMTDLKSIV